MTTKVLDRRFDLRVNCDAKYTIISLMARNAYSFYLFYWGCSYLAQLLPTLFTFYWGCSYLAQLLPTVWILQRITTIRSLQ